MSACHAQPLYHVTPLTSWHRIRRTGLVPRRGPRACACREEGDAVYLFVSREAVENALDNWLGEAFEETTRLVLLQVHLPEGAVLDPDVAAGFERVCRSPIAAHRISLLEEV